MSVCAREFVTIFKFHSNQKKKFFLVWVLVMPVSFFSLFSLTYRMCFLLSKLLFNYAIRCDLFHVRLFSLNRLRVTTAAATATAVKRQQYKTNGNNNWRLSTTTTTKRSIITFVSKRVSSKRLKMGKINELQDRRRTQSIHPIVPKPPHFIFVVGVCIYLTSWLHFTMVGHEWLVFCLSVYESMNCELISLFEQNKNSN